MKKILYASSLVLVAVLAVLVLHAFGLLEAATTRVVGSDLGKWTILVNTTDVTSQVVDFNIDTINYDSNTGIKSGKLAPGIGGYFDIEIDPTDTEVAIRYDITFDYTNLEDTETTLAVTSVTEISNKTLTQTGESTYTGIIPLSQIEDEETDTIRTRISWTNNESKNDKDYELGKTANTAVEIPVSIKLTQYVGEQIVGYEGD